MNLSNGLSTRAAEAMDIIEKRRWQPFDQQKRIANANVAL